MSKPIRPIAGGLSTLVVAGLLAASPPAASALDPASGPNAVKPNAANTTHTVTLVTGDVVTVSDSASGPQAISVEPAPTSTGGTRTQVVKGDTYVVPDAALPYLASGRLDRDLFNVTQLIAQGYDDASSDEVPLIVRYRPGTRSQAAEARGADRTARLPSINGAALGVDKGRAARFWTSITPEAAPSGEPGRFQAGIGHVYLDEKVEASLADSVAQVGAPEAWDAGLDGSGTTVAVLDTGVDTTHPDLADQVTATQSFVPGETVEDVDGHGTHVASTIAGTGAASDGVEKGVAPGADLIAGKVLGNDGFGQASWIIDGMEWAATRADVVNMSLGSYEPSDGTDPMAVAVNELSASTDALFVIAAGNYGRVSGIGSPGAADAALTVGAVDANDERAYFQDMGPRLGDAGMKPEIVAPGVDILAARSSQAAGSGYYTTKSGTSMATPHVAGAAAILTQQHPTWTGEQIKNALASTAMRLDGETPYRVGDGRLDVPAAAFADVVATAARSFGLFTWPHGGDALVDRSVTYTNLTDTPVTLDLSVEVTDQGLDPAPDGLVELSDTQVIVPANGTASVTATAYPDLGAADTTYSGYVVASRDGQPVAHTAVGLVKEQEMYSLDISALDRGGKPTGGYVTVYRHGDLFVYTYAIDPETGTVPTLRLQPGSYDVTSWLPVDGAHGPNSAGVALVGSPHVQVDQDTEVVLDAREANEIKVETPRPSEPTARQFGYYYGGFVNRYGPSPAVDTVYANPMSDLPYGGFTFAAWWHQPAPLLDMAIAGLGGGPLDEFYQRGSKRWDGRGSLNAVSAGTGTPAEIAGVDAAGKAVLVERNDDVDPAARARAAMDAGARLLVVVNDRPGKLYEYAGGTDLPVVSLTASEGQPLLERLANGGSVDLRLAGTEFPPYLYDLAKDYEGSLPAKLHYEPSRTELAVVHQEFVGPRPALAFHGRGLCRNWFWPPCAMVSDPVQQGGTRTDYVSSGAPDGGGWYEKATDLRGWELRDDVREYGAGTETTRAWFGPVMRPRVGAGYWHPRRDGDFFAVNVPSASAGDQGLTGHLDYGVGTNVNRLYQNGELVDTSSGFHSVQTPVPQTEGWATYRFEQSNALPVEDWTYSTRTESAWTFRAQTDRRDNWVDLPLLQVDFHIDTDVRGMVRSGSRQTIGVTAFHFDGVEGAGQVSGAELEISFDDGDSWQPLALQPGADGSWRAEVTTPRSGAQFASLRVAAWDDAGNRVEQEVIRAYGIG